MKKMIFFILFILIIGIGITIYFINVPKVALRYNNVSINEDIMIKDIISIKRGNLVKDEKVNTNKLGTIKIKVIVQDILKKEHSYDFEVTVVDLEKPKITYSKEIIGSKGKTTNLLENVTVSDNSLEELHVHVEGSYDFNEVGEYTIYYVAKDSSGNEAREEAKIIVKENTTVNNTTVADRVFTTSKGFQLITKDGVTTINGVLIVNKTYSLPENFGDGLTKETQDAFEKMRDDAKKEGLTIYIDSGFRSFAKQKSEYQYFVSRDGLEKADTYSARPGYSEHQSGLTFDVNSNGPSFNYTKEANWLSNNCYKYGFILRYPEGKEKETGYMYESWHFRYVGEELASKLYHDGDWITLESYFGITSEYPS